jgi:predicted GIY-YIG superfamily endonuclease
LDVREILKKELLNIMQANLSIQKTRGLGEIKYYEAFYSKEDAFFREGQLKRNARLLQELKKML